MGGRGRGLEGGRRHLGVGAPFFHYLSLNYAKSFSKFLWRASIARMSHRSLSQVEDFSVIKSFQGVKARVISESVHSFYPHSIITYNEFFRVRLNIKKNRDS